MNWRGRPLTSHEVVVATIASTRNRTGLAVAAELDTGRYPLGISVTREALRALPIEAHEQRGEWNYTVAPAGDVVPVRAEHRARATTVALAMLADERLTGMEAGELAELTGLLAPAQAAQAAQRCHEQRGGPRRRAPGAGSQGLLSGADRVLVTIVYLRQLCSQNILSDLLGVNANSIGQAIAETRLLLTEHGRVITPTTLRFTERLSHRQAARAEGHRHRRRGGERLPEPAAACSDRRSPTPNACWAPSSTSAASAPKTPSPICSRSADAPSATSYAKSRRCWARTDTTPHPPRHGSPPQLPCSTP